MTTLELNADPAELLRLKSRHIMPCVYHFFRNPPHIVSGRGALLVDHLGKTYIDCLSGVGVMNAGHCEPAIIEPAIEQIRTLQHTSTIFLTEPALRLAETLTEIMPRPLSRSFFCASGSEAVEGAMLLAQLHTRRPRFIVFEDSLHGRTRWTMNATGLPFWRTDPFPTDEFIRVPFGNVGALSQALNRNHGTVAAVLGESIQGNGGINVPHELWWPEVRELCDQFNVLLVLDEVQTGFNRTGRWFACEHWSITPDIMAVSKGLGNGFPIAAFVTNEEIAGSYTRPGASTFGGNPVSSIAAMATIEFHKQHDLGKRATALGHHLQLQLQSIARSAPNLFEEPRGIGLMCGLPVRASDPGRTAQLCDELLERLKDAGVLAGKTGRHRNVLTFMPPLVVTQEQLDSVCNALQEAVDCHKESL